jgi:16S rRNA (cytosine1402-N4)-methyltransferase
VSARHEPVLVEEVLRFLRNGTGLYLDATLGDSGHAIALLEAEPGARLLGCDRDQAALAASEARLMRFAGRVSLAHAAFHDLPAVHARSGGEPFAGALLDLGLSSRQLDDPARGMSFQSDGPLDMRMDRAAGPPASERLQGVDATELARVLREYGDVPEAGRLARQLVSDAHAGRLETTRALVAAVSRALRGRPHPRRYAQVFQALRSWVNDEAAELDGALAWLPDAMSPGGVVVTLAYHSGEDRRIKRALRGARLTRPARRLPEIPGQRPPEGRWDELTKRVITPSTDETERNPRARSARLRAFRRVKP